MEKVLEEGDAETGTEAVTVAETGHRGRGRERNGRGLMGLKKGREILTEKKRLQRCSAVRCGTVLREWRKSPGVGRGQGVNGPLYYSILSPGGGQRQ